MDSLAQARIIIQTLWMSERRVFIILLYLRRIGSSKITRCYIRDRLSIALSSRYCWFQHVNRIFVNQYNVAFIQNFNQTWHSYAILLVFCRLKKLPEEITTRNMIAGKSLLKWTKSRANNRLKFVWISFKVFYHTLLLIITLYEKLICKQSVTKFMTITELGDRWNTIDVFLS